MPKIVPIVEGDGEVEAVPILLRKLLQEMERWDIEIAPPRSAHGCNNLTKAGGVEKYVQYAKQEPDCAAILILMDAEDNCAKELAEEFSRRVQAIGALFPVVTVIAKCEYEAWFLASLDTIVGKNLKGRPGLPDGLQYPGDVEARTGVKEWLKRQLPEGRSYRETEDQAAMTQWLDTNLARSRSRSFRRLWHAIEEVLAAIENEAVIVTPLPAPESDAPRKKKSGKRSEKP